MTKISSIKPGDDETKRRPVPMISWNNKAEQSIIEQGFGPEESKDGTYVEPLDIYTQENLFLSEVDTRQGPIIREVTRIFRIKAIDWTSEKRERKEYLYYEENWYGKNWLGVKIAPVTSHLEGQFKQTTKQLELDKNTGQGLYYKMGKRLLTFYIPYNKKTVDKIIAGYYDKDPKESVRYINNIDSIKFVVMFASEDSPPGQMRAGTHGEFSYDQFANWTFDQLYKWHIKPWKDQDPNYGPNMSSYK